MKQATENKPPKKARSENVVLLAILGETPAVITETLWALAEDSTWPFPSTISILTTQANKLRFQENVMESGQWEELACQLGSRRETPKILPLPEILVLPQPGGRDLDDIQSSEDVVQAGDYMLRWVRGYAEQPETKILGSLSGGRKTMTALFTTCMTLLGKDYDVMLHVHIDSPFDRPMEPPFLFPKPGDFHRTSDGKKYSSKNAKVNLFEVPFTQLNTLYSKTWGHAPSSFKELIGQRNTAQEEKRHSLYFVPDHLLLEVDGEDALTLSTLEVDALKYLWVEHNALPQGWGGNEDHRTASGRVKNKLRKLAWGEAAIEEFIPNFRKRAQHDQWPPKGLRIKKNDP